MEITCRGSNTDIAVDQTLLIQNVFPIFLADTTFCQVVIFTEFFNVMKMLSVAKIVKKDTIKPVLNGHSQKKTQIRFQDQLLLNTGQK